MITFTVTSIILSILLYYSFNYTSYPKYYIINKYNDMLLNYYDLKLNLTKNNTDFKQDVLSALKEIFYVISFLDFDSFIDDHKKFNYMNNFEYDLFNNVSIHNHLDKYSLYNITYTEFRHYYFEIINSNLSTIIHQDIDKYISKYIFDQTEIFFQTFNSNIKKFTSLNINSKYDLDKIFFLTINDDRFSSLFDNSDILNKFKEYIKNVEINYYCIEIINNICTDNFNNIQTKKLKIYETFDFTGKYVILNRCCTY